MSQKELNHQDRIRRAAIEQEQECGVLANESSPRLPREACDRIRERRLGRLSATLLDVSFPHLFKDIDFLTFVDTLSPTRPKKLTATYELELYRYSAYEFDLLAGEYMKLNPTASQLSEWLLNLSGLVEKEVFRRWRLKWDIHITREVQKEMVRSSLKDCVTNWLKEPSRSEAAGSNGSAERPSNDDRISEQSVSSKHFSDPDINKQIVMETARLRARILEADSECTISNFDDFLVETIVENLDLHASAYLRKVTEESLIKEYITYLRNVGSDLLRNAEERSHLQDPYSEKRLRETAERTGSLIMRRSKLTEEQYEQEVQKLIEEGRTAMRSKAVAWHAWKNQIVVRMFSRMEARYSHWYAEANSRLLNRLGTDHVVDAVQNSGSEGHDQPPIGGPSESSINKEPSGGDTDSGVDPVLEEAGHLPKNSVTDNSLGSEMLNPPRAIAQERQKSLQAFKDKGRELKIRITDEMVAKMAKHTWNDRTMITWWKRNDLHCQAPHDRLIRNVLEKDPASLWPSK